MKRILFLTISILLFFASADARKRVVDAVSQSPEAKKQDFRSGASQIV